MENTSEAPRIIPLKDSSPATACMICGLREPTVQLSEMYFFELCTPCFERGLAEIEQSHAEGLGHAFVSTWYDAALRDKYQNHIVATCMGREGFDRLSV